MRRAAAPWIMLACLAGIGLDGRAVAQPCTKDSVATHPGAWRENAPDLAMARDSAPEARHPAILKRIEPLAPMFREAYPSPRGTAAEGYASIRLFGRELSVGPAQYGYTTLYKTWMCPARTRQPELAGETGNWAYVQVNSLHYFLKQVGDKPLQVDGRPTKVWLLARRTGKLRGETLYETWMGISHGRGLVFSRPGREPWKPLSQKQYLDALAHYFRAGQDATHDAMDQAVRGMEKNLEEVKRTLSGEMRDKVVAEMQRAIADMRAQRPTLDAKLSRGVANALKNIEDYRTRHSASEMAQPAVLPAGGGLGFVGEFGSESDGGHLLVRLDASYFRKNLPREAAQLVTLAWRREGDSPASDAWRESFEQRFPIERLRAMIDR